MSAVLQKSVKLNQSLTHSGMGRPIDMEWKGSDSSIHDHDID